MNRHRRKIALLKVLAAAAWADGRLDHEEIQRIKELMLAYDLDPAELREVEILLDAPVSYGRCEELTRELLGMLEGDAERREVLEEVEALFRADGTMDAAEEEVLTGLRGIMDSMSAVDGFMSRITGVFRRVLGGRSPGDPPGELTEYLKNVVLRRLHDLSGGAWVKEIDAPTLNFHTLFGAVLGKVAATEDGVSEAEIARIRELLVERLGMEPPLLDWVVQAIRESSSIEMDRQALLSEFNRIAEMPHRLDLLDAAFAVAAADGVVGEAELEELRLISNVLWIDARNFNEIRMRWARRV